MSRVKLLCSGLAFVLLSSLAADRPAPAPMAGASIAELQKARVDVANEGLQMAEQRYKVGLTGQGEAVPWVRRLAEARLEMAQSKDQRVAILTEWLKAMREEESRIKKNFDAGIPSTNQADMLMVKFERLEVELRLAKARAE